MKRETWHESLYDLEDEINPNPGRYIPTEEEMAAIERQRLHDQDYEDWQNQRNAASRGLA